MNRQLKGLSYRVFDVLVIGGGIHGASIAWEAAQRGLDVALVDRDDFGAGTSANSLKIIHGGLRYLQTADLKRVRESIRERSAMLRIAPHLVRPLPCVLPLYRHGGLKSPFFMRAALKAADAVGFDRNSGLEADRSLTGGRVVSARETARIAPGIRKEGLIGGAVWTDAQMTNPARLVLSFILAAQRAGATTINHAEVKQLIRGGRRVIGATLRDRLTNQEFTLWARVTVNAAGPWAEDVARLAETAGGESAPGLSAAMNLIIRRPLNAGHAIGASRPGGPVLFVTPWRGLTLVGTRHWGFSGTADRFKVTGADIATFLKELNLALPGAKAIPADVVGVLSGLLPGTVNRQTGEVDLLKRQRIVDHEKRDGIQGLVSVVGIKFTTARFVAEQAVNVVMQRLGRRESASATEVTPLHGGKTGPLSDYITAQVTRHAGKFSPTLVQRLIETYGSEYERVLSYIDERGEEPLEGAVVLPAEIEYAVRNELGCALADVVFRRTEMAITAPPSEASVEAAGKVMGSVLGWDTAKRRREIEEALKEISSVEAVSSAARTQTAEAV